MSNRFINICYKFCSLLCRSPELVKSPLGSPGSPRSTHQEIVMATPSSGDLGNQPNIDLQISLRQRWRGCNTLLIDVAPYWLVVNETDLDLVILENNDQQWRLPRKQTFAPPEFDGPFRLALVMENRLHPSNPVTLSLQEITFGYLQGQQDTLYRQGHLKTAIPVVINKKTTQVKNNFLFREFHFLVSITIFYIYIYF